jgi:ribonuclease M5
MTYPRIQEIIVVEGRNDTAAIRRAVEADTIETRGSAIGPEVISQIRRAQEMRGVIVFTDPDHAGERIRRIISREVPGVKHAFLPQHQARDKQKVGIEHASPDAIRTALSEVRTEWREATVPPLTWEEYLDLGFAGHGDSRRFRLQVAEVLGIGYANAKQFYRRLHILCISREELEQAIQEVRKDAENERQTDRNQDA